MKYIIFLLFITGIVYSQTEDCIKNCMDEMMECLDDQSTVCYCIFSVINCEIKGDCYTDKQKELINDSCVNYGCPFCTYNKNR